MVERTDLYGFSLVAVIRQTEICSSCFLEEGSDELSGTLTEGLCDPRCFGKIDFMEMKIIKSALQSG